MGAEEGMGGRPELPRCLLLGPLVHRCSMTNSSRQGIAPPPTQPPHHDVLRRQGGSSVGAGANYEAGLEGGGSSEGPGGGALALERHVGQHLLGV